MEIMSLEIYLLLDNEILFVQKCFCTQVSLKEKSRSEIS